MSCGKVFGGTTWHGSMGYNFHVTEITVEKRDGFNIIKWTDPCDIEWIGTKLIRKAGEYPKHIADGVLVVDSAVHNQYAVLGYEDGGLESGTAYFYKAFPYSLEGANTSHLNQAVPAKYVSYSGTHKDEIVTVVGEKKRLLTITKSGVLTVTGDVRGDVWMCAGGGKGENGVKGSNAESSNGGSGGCGGRSEERLDIALSSGAVVIGAANGGTTSYAGISALGSNTRSGGTGGGAGGDGNSGTGDGKSKTPFGLIKLFPQRHCAGGGGGAYYTGNSSPKGGNVGGTDGEHGGWSNESRTSGGAGGKFGGGEGGAASENGGNNGKSATFYGGGGGGGGAHYFNSTVGTGGSGYQGVMYILLPFDVK